MSRIPIHFEPRPTDTVARTFRVLSEEWTGDPKSPVQLATVYVDDRATACTFVPGPLWLAEVFFPRGEMTFTAGALEALCTEKSYEPQSIYSHRTLQAMRSILSARSESAV
jgi:hypothetical protein